MFLKLQNELEYAIRSRGRGCGNDRHLQAVHGRVALLAARHLRHLPTRDVGLQLRALLLLFLLATGGHNLRAADQVQIQEQQRVHGSITRGGALGTSLAGLCFCWLIAN